MEAEAEAEELDIGNILKEWAVKRSKLNLSLERQRKCDGLLQTAGT